jgi:hypothetical protein
LIFEILKETLYIDCIPLGKMATIIEKHSLHSAAWGYIYYLKKVFE